MAVTRLKRKGLRNKARAKQRQEAIKKFTHLPPIQKVDVEAIKAEFAQKKSGSSSPQQDASSTSSAQPQAEPKAAPKSATSSEEKTSNKPTAEVREPAKGSVEDAEMVEEKLENSEDTSPKVEPNVISPEAGAPDETPSEADER